MKTSAGSRRVSRWAVGVILVSGVVAAQSPRPWSSIPESRLLAPHDGDWMSYRRTYDVQAFSPLREIIHSTEMAMTMLELPVISCAATM